MTDQEHPTEFRTETLGYELPPFAPAPAATLSPSIARILTDTQPWARTMGILGFVTVGFMILGGLAAGVVGVATGNLQSVMLMIFYPVLGILYIVPSMYLLRYANRIRDFAAQGHISQLESALDAQRAFWKFVGILTIISISVSILAVMAAIVFGILAAAASV
jgi:hypothetical protein